MIESVVCFVLMAAGPADARAPVNRHAPAPYAHATAQSRNSITGSVYNPQRRPIQNVRVELLRLLHIADVSGAPFAKGPGPTARIPRQGRVGATGRATLGMREGHD